MSLVPIYKIEESEKAFKDYTIYIYIEELKIILIYHLAQTLDVNLMNK